MIGGIDVAREFFIQMLRDLERVAEHFDMSEDLTAYFQSRTWPLSTGRPRASKSTD